MTDNSISKNMIGRRAVKCATCHRSYLIEGVLYGDYHCIECHRNDVVIAAKQFYGNETRGIMTGVILTTSRLIQAERRFEESISDTAFMFANGELK